jgi:hypothetical protein
VWWCPHGRDPRSSTLCPDPAYSYPKTHHSSTAARLNRLGEFARYCDSASLQPLHQHNLDCVRKSLDRSHHNSCTVCVGQPLLCSRNRARPIPPHWTYSQLALDVLNLEHERADRGGEFHVVEVGVCRRKGGCTRQFGLPCQVLSRGSARQRLWAL